MGTDARRINSLMEYYLFDEEAAEIRARILSGATIGDDIEDAVFRIQEGDLEDGIGLLEDLRDTLNSVIEEVSSLPWPRRKTRVG